MGVDGSLAGVAPFPTFFAWMPECAMHDGAFNDDSFYNATISTSASSYTMRRWVEEFMKAPRVGVAAWQIDGAFDTNGNLMRTTNCR